MGIAKTHSEGLFVKAHPLNSQHVYHSTFENVNSQTTLIRCLSILFSLSIAPVSFGALADTKTYRKIMEDGIAQMEDSYKIDQAARKKGEEAAEICKAKGCASEMRLEQLNEDKKRLTQQSDALAEEALKKFRSAQAIDPGNPEPIFWEGLALLQLKEYCSAITKMRSVKEAGYRNPKQPGEVTFALGSALVGSSGIGAKEFQEGIQYLTEYINQAQTNTNSETEFPNLDAATQIRKGAVEKRQNLADKNKQKNEEPNLASCPLPIPGRTELPFAASVSSGMGYNDNVITLGRAQPLPPGVTQKGSSYNESTFTLGRDFSFSHPSPLSQTTGWLSDKLSLKYALIADTFVDLPSRDTVLQTVSGSYSRSFTPQIAGLLKLSDQWLYFDQRLTSNLFSAQEGLALNITTRSKTLLSYFLIRKDGFTASPPSANPDGFTHRLELAETFVLVQDEDDFSPTLTLTGQYAHEWNQPSGIATQFERDDLLGKLEWKIFHARNRCSFVRGVTAAISDQWKPDRYDHATFRVLGTGSLFARSDDTNTVSFALSMPMWYDQRLENAGVPDGNRLEANLDFRHTTRDSNVQSKIYDQNVFLVSLKLNF